VRGHRLGRNDEGDVRVFDVYRLAVHGRRRSSGTAEGDRTVHVVLHARRRRPARRRIVVLNSTSLPLPTTPVPAGRAGPTFISQPPRRQDVFSFHLPPPRRRLLKSRARGRGRGEGEHGTEAAEEGGTSGTNTPREESAKCQIWNRRTEHPDGGKGKWNRHADQTNGIQKGNLRRANAPRANMRHATVPHAREIPRGESPGSSIPATAPSLRPH